MTAAKVSGGAKKTPAKKTAAKKAPAHKAAPTPAAAARQAEKDDAQLRADQDHAVAADDKRHEKELAAAEERVGEMTDAVTVEQRAAGVETIDESNRTIRDLNLVLAARVEALGVEQLVYAESSRKIEGLSNEVVELRRRVAVATDYHTSAFHEAPTS